uniref:Uncharacterized protein n=1 Tax=Microviridae sp. ctpIT6 TaxID=2827650 RepID=A0A8S5SUV4_9VIRU|nr:MAG TPA: hypothetical protein [Microviridae sp. ctpIT6]
MQLFVENLLKVLKVLKIVIRMKIRHLAGKLRRLLRTARGDRA